jgi:pyruvate/2-oxoglutarate dehydrogenase complex dihydrolipoamide acyltransferase (E2) component
LPLVVFLAWTPAAYAWSWPVQGPVLRPFSFDEAHPYVAGQHRGIDIGADAVGDAVAAPAAGTVSFAGTVPTNGMSVTIQTTDGHSVTLTHLGSILVAKGATVAEREPVGTVGPSGTAEVGGPYVHLGIRVTDDPDGYVDPLGFLPPAATGGVTQADPAPAQPNSSGGSSAAPTHEPTRAAPASSPVPNAQGSAAPRARSHASQPEKQGVQEPRTEVRTRPASQRPVQAGEPRSRPSRPAETQRRQLTEPENSSRRPDVETSAPREPTGLDAGHEFLPRAPTLLLPLILNGLAASVAVGAALAAARTRRRRNSGWSPVAAAQVLQLPQSSREHGPLSRAA